MKVIITGANKGIGLGLAKEYKKRGWEVLALCRNASDELKTLGVAIEENVDVRDQSSLQKAAQNHANERFDLLINNAGVNRRMTLDSIDFDAIEEQFQINALGPLKTTLAFLPLLNEGAKIAMISSIAGSIASISEGGRYGYRISKAALNILSVSMALDLKKRRIAVVILHPGLVKTDLAEGRGEITPEDAAPNLLKRIEELTMEKSGYFLHEDGSRLPW